MSLQKGGFREIHLVRFLPAKMIHQRGNWWIREIKSRFRSQKLSKQKKNKAKKKQSKHTAASEAQEASGASGTEEAEENEPGRANQAA